MTDPPSDRERLRQADKHSASEIEFLSVPTTSPRHWSAKPKPPSRPRRQPRILVGAASWTGTSAISFVGSSHAAGTANWSAPAPWAPSAGIELARQIAAALREMLPASPAPPAEPAPNMWVAGEDLPRCRPESAGDL